MSAEKKTLATIKVVTDHDCGMYYIGEIDGSGFEGLDEHIRSHGSEELLKHLAYLTYQVVAMSKEIQGQEQQAQGAGERK